MTQTSALLYVVDSTDLTQTPGKGQLMDDARPNGRAMKECALIECAFCLLLAFFLSLLVNVTDTTIKRQDV